jgi:chromosome segregation ATPase
MKTISPRERPPSAIGLLRRTGRDHKEKLFTENTQSAELAIAEEKAKAAKGGESSEESAKIPKPSEDEMPSSRPTSEADTGRVRELEKEVMDLKITNRGKDYFIEQLQKERDGVLNQIAGLSRQVGQLETQVRQLSAPLNGSEDRNMDVSNTERK